jgi:hypothetical protein
MLRRYAEALQISAEELRSVPEGDVHARL